MDMFGGTHSNLTVFFCLSPPPFPPFFLSSPPFLLLAPAPPLPLPLLPRLPPLSSLPSSLSLLLKSP